MTPEFEDDLQALLVAHSGLAAIVDDRIWPDFIDRQTDVEMPCIIRIVGYSVDGTLDDSAAEVLARLVFEVYSEDRRVLLEINRQLQNCMNGLVASTLGGARVVHVLFQSYEPVSIERSAGQPMYAAVITYNASLNF